jgi:2-dehydropantoate 2-reductase
MRIGIMGSGGLGGYFGTVLARAGHDVAFIARGAHLEAMRARGLTLKSVALGEITLPVNATDQPQSVGPVDLVLLCVKTYDLDAAAEQILPLVGPETVVIPIQNGVDAVERTGRVVGSEHILRGISWVGGYVEGPGIVAHTSGASIELGEPEGGTSTHAERFGMLFKEAGLDVVIPTSIRLAEWQKFVANCGSFGVLGLARLPFGPVMECPETRALLRGVFEEGIRVAQANSIPIPDTYIDVVMGIAASRPYEQRSSLLTDLLAGKRLELESINGALVRLGAKLGVPTPLNLACYAALKPYVNGAPNMS